MRQQEINEQAQRRSDICSTQYKDVYRIAFREGAEWADENPKIFEDERLTTLLDDFEEYPADTKQFSFLFQSIIRDMNDKVTAEFVKELDEIPADKGIIAHDSITDKLFLIDREHAEDILNDNPTLDYLLQIEL